MRFAVIIVVTNPTREAEQVLDLTEITGAIIASTVTLNAALS
jgi:hypothetical protein